MTKRRGRPAQTPEDRELQLIALSMDEAERQILRGDVSAQVLTHFLRLGSTRNALEEQKLAHETELLRHRTAALESQQRIEEKYEAAMEAFAKYKGEDQG